MRTSHCTTAAIVACACAALGGCHSVAPATSAGLDALLKPAAIRRDQVLLEIYQVRVPPERAAAAAATWSAVDEQFLEPELRGRLLANGFRAGIVGRTMPDGLAKMLNLADAPAEADGKQVIDQQAANPQVVKQVKQLGSQEELQAQVGPLQKSLQLLISDETVHGKSYDQAQTTYLVKGSSQAGQRVRLQVTPELQHGDMRSRYTDSEQGMFMLTVSREREPFPDLRIEAELAPGDSLLLGGLADASGSLGDAFHGKNAAGETRLVLIRVAKVPESEILAEK